MKTQIELAIADLLGIALAHASEHLGSQAAEAAAHLSGCLARHPFSDVPEAELWEFVTGPDLCSFLGHETVLCHYKLVAKYEGDEK